MDNLSHITNAIIVDAIAALVRGKNSILGETGGFGREETIYAIDASIAALQGREYVRTPVGNDACQPDRPIGERELLGLAREKFAEYFLEWSGEPSFGLDNGKVYVLACQGCGDNVGALEDALLVCHQNDLHEKLAEELFMAACRNEWFGLSERLVGAANQ